MAGEVFQNPDWFMEVIDKRGIDSSEAEETLTARIIIWSYNRPKMLRQAVQSVFDQNYKNMEIIIVDDGSDLFNPIELQKEFDDSRLVVAQASQISLDERASVSRLGENTNFVLDTFDKDDIVYYLCDDDFMANDWISTTMKIFNEYPKHHVIQGDTLMFDGENFLSTWKPQLKYSNPTSTADALYMVAGSFCHRAYCYLEEGLKWEDNEYLHSQDAAFIRNIFRIHPDILICNKQSLFRRVHEFNLANALEDDGYFKPRDGKISKETLKERRYE